MKESCVLLHGWDPACYNGNMPGGGDVSYAWRNRQELVAGLETSFDVTYYTYPGFCNAEEPNEEYWGVDDFTKHFSGFIEGLETDPEILVGYSFGGAILLNHAKINDSKIPRVLLAPAIVRNERPVSKLAGMVSGSFPQGIQDHLRSLYQYIFSKYYREGSPFLKSSYNKIVREDLRLLITETGDLPILYLYGDRDNATPWEMVKPYVTNVQAKYGLISGAGHDFGTTHPKEILEQILIFNS